MTKTKTRARKERQSERGESEIICHNVRSGHTVKYVSMEECRDKADKAHQPNKWQGRTKKQVAGAVDSNADIMTRV